MKKATGIMIYEMDGIRYMADDQENMRLSASEAELTELDVCYDDQIGYVHADGTPIRLNEL